MQHDVFAFADLLHAIDTHQQTLNLEVQVAVRVVLVVFLKLAVQALLVKVTMVETV
jgi:hypothetical protein